MAQVTLTIGGRSHDVCCEDGQEEHVLALGRRIDERVSLVSTSVGGASGDLLMILVALTLADEVQEAHRMREGADAESKRLKDVSEQIALEADQEVQRVEAASQKAIAERDAAVSTCQEIEGRVSELEGHVDTLKEQLGEAHQALESARHHLEQRCNEKSVVRQAEEAFAEAIERMAQRVERVAQTLVSS